MTDMEKAEMNYEKYKTDHGEGGDIKEQDKLRILYDDKKALVQRAQKEHDSQVIYLEILIIKSQWTIYAHIRRKRENNF